MMDVKFKKLNPEAIPFAYTRKGDVCMDMYALKDTTLAPNETKIIETGIALEIPEGYEGIIRGRSGFASKGIQVHVGTVESTYRGDVGVVIHNATSNTFDVHKGMRIAQFTIKPVIQIELHESDILTETERGTQGYGSSGT